MVINSQMKLFGHQAIAWMGAAVCSSMLLPAGVEAGVRNSQRVKPVIENIAVEKPAFAKPQMQRHNATVASRVETPVLEKPRREQFAVVKPTRERPSFVSPNTSEIFRRPEDYQKTEALPRSRLVTTHRHFVPGHGYNLDGYRLGKPARIREHCRPHDQYYFRNQNQRKADDEF